MRFTSQRLTPVQSAMAAEVIPANVIGSVLVYESKEDMSQSLTSLRSDIIGSKAGRLRCLRSIIRKVEQMIDDPHAYEHTPVRLKRSNQRPEIGDRIIPCTAQQTVYLRDTQTLSKVRWASGDSKKSKFFVKEADVPELIQSLQDLYHDEILPHNRRVISTIARKLGDDTNPVIITADNETVSSDRLNCLAYVCQKAGIDFVQSAAHVHEMISMKDADTIIEELKLLASMVAGSSRVCWSLISKLERLRGSSLTKVQHIQFEMEVELLKEGPSDVELAEAALFEAELMEEEEPQPAPLEEVTVESLELDETEEGPNCFFAEESWGELEEYDESAYDDDDDDATWFVYMNISNCLSLLDIPEDERYQIDGDDISFKVEEDRDEWCEEMRGAVEDLIEFDELDQEQADMCLQEINALDRMTSIL